MTRSPWLTVGVVLIGSYASVLNGQITGVALPAIAEDLGDSGAPDVDWVVTSYLIAVVMVQPLVGWLCSRIGRCTVFNASLLIFSCGAMLCVVAPTLNLLIVGRFIQGLGGGAIIPVGMAIVFELFPAGRRGRAMSIWGVATLAGPAIGPPLGGWIVSTTDWRWIFGLFASVGLVAAAIGWGSLRETGSREERNLDVIGWALASAAVMMIVLGARQSATWGILSRRTVGLAVLSIVVVASLVRRSLRQEHPVIEFRIFASPAFSLGIIVVSLMSVVQFTRFNFVPIELQIVRGLDAQSAGLLMVPAAVGAAVSMPIGGWLADHVGSRAPVMIGLLITSVGVWQLAHLQATGPESDVLVALLIQGLGHGLVTIPATVMMMNSVHARYVTDSSVVSAIDRQLSGAIGVAALGAIVIDRLGAVAPVGADVVSAQAAYNHVFMIGFWLLGPAVLCAGFLPGRRAFARQQR